MSSGARVKANRLNAQKSTGPRTEEGKAVVSQNAIKHGLSGQCDVIRGEDQEEFNQYREEVFWELVPVGIMQSRLVERIVSLAWRLRRAERLQNEAFEALIEKEASSSSSWLTGAWRSKGVNRPADEADLSPGVIAAKDFMHDRVLDRLLMYERRIESSLYRTMNELRKLQHEQDRESGAAVRSGSARASVGAGPCARPGQPQGVAPTASRQGATTDAADFAKQSQSASGETASTESSKKEGTPCGVTTSAGECARQSQSADGGVCSVPVRASPRMQDIAPPYALTADAADFTKQSQLRPGKGVHGTPYERSDVPPRSEGVTDSVKESQWQPGDYGNGDAPDRSENLTGFAKQSQSY